MRNYLALLITLVALAACGGGGGGGSSSPTSSTIPVGTVSGISFDGLILNGTVNVYDYTTGAKGALLGQATTDGNGLYSLSLKIESRPVLLEITGGYYIEEAGSGSTQVALSPTQKLSAVANYTTGSALKVAVTTYSNLAAGLAAYEISKGTAVSTAINDANARASTLAGVNILTTTPKEITDVANASATLTPELRYGFLAGAISMWTYNHAPSPTSALVAPYTSIDFAQLLYQDIAADGLLDGFGLDSTGAKAQLSFGTTPLGVDVYRLGIGAGIVQIAANANNKSGLTGAQVLSFAQAYIASSDAMFNGVAPTAFAAQTNTITAPTANVWTTATINITSSATSPFGLASSSLLIDGVTVFTLTTGLAAPSFALDTTKYTDGAHSVAVQSTDLGGFVRTTSQTVSFDNTWPTAAAVIPYAFSTSTGLFSVVTCVTETGSGIASVINITRGIAGTSLGNGCWNLPVYGSVYFDQIRVRDNVGNCSTYNGAINGQNGNWGLVSQTKC